MINDATHLAVTAIRIMPSHSIACDPAVNCFSHSYSVHCIVPSHHTEIARAQTFVKPAHALIAQNSVEHRNRPVEH